MEVFDIFEFNCNLETIPHEVLNHKSSIQKIYIVIFLRFSYIMRLRVKLSNFLWAIFWIILVICRRSPLQHSLIDIIYANTVSSSDWLFVLIMILIDLSFLITWISINSLLNLFHNRATYFMFFYHAEHLQNRGIIVFKVVDDCVRVDYDYNFWEGDLTFFQNGRIFMIIYHDI